MVRKLIALTIQLETVKKITDTRSRPKTPFEYEIPTGFLISGTRLHGIIDCSFELKIDSNVNDYIQFAYQRCVEVGIYPKESKFKDKIIKALEKAYYVHLAVGVLPNTSDITKQEALVTWILLLFAFDNVIDNSNGVIPNNKTLLQTYVDTLNLELTSDKHTENDLQKILREYNVPEKEIEDALKPIRLAKFLRGQTPAFYKEAHKYFESSLTELEKPEDIGLMSYIFIRLVSGAVDTVIRLAEGDLPDYFSGSQVFNFPHMNHQLVLYICLVNDLGGAKEFNSHEPGYIKIRYKELLNSYKEAGIVENSNLRGKILENTLQELIKIINFVHEKYFIMKKQILETIESGYIFSGSTYQERFFEMNEAEKAAFIDEVRADFLKRCDIRENLAAAGNECTKVSTRYYDVFNPLKNIEITTYTL